MSKILFIYEGKNSERKFCKLIIDKYFPTKRKHKEYVSFRTNIYALYDELRKDDGLDIVFLVTEKAKKRGSIEEYNKLKNGGFAEIYLIFDFDPQGHLDDYQKINISKIKKMVKFFDNETTMGKIYLNYPMIESFKHFTSIPDVNYNSYVVRLEDCKKYKEHINDISVITHYGLITEEQLDNIISQNLDKYSYISSKSLDTYSDYIKNFSQYKLLNIQLKKLKECRVIYIFNTAVFWVIDYFGEKNYNKYNIVKNDKVLKMNV